ncbi:MAG: hypothetical protein J6A92_05610 [Lachnospiraceae bacterium]|nr:hypothetical protein [Lachnospiraceae bacterium]
MVRNYLKADMYRLLCSPQLYIAAGSVLAVYMVSTLQNMWGGCVLDTFWIVKFYSFIICMFAGASISFSNSLLEDTEHKFFEISILRGNCKAYVRSKVICCFVASVSAIICGTVLYAALLHTKIPFFSEIEGYSNVDAIRENEIFGSLITENGFVLYFVCSGLMMGLLGGMLSLVSMWLSLIVKNRMFAICFPIIGYYFAVNYLSGLFGMESVLFDINGIYLYFCYVFEGKPIYSFLYAVFLAVCVSLVLEKGIYQRVCRRWR